MPHACGSLPIAAEEAAKQRIVPRQEETLRVWLWRRPDLVPIVSGAYASLGSWLCQGQLPIVYHPIYNIGKSEEPRNSRRARTLTGHVLTATIGKDARPQACAASLLARGYSLSTDDLQAA